jgi:hypothetical protein
MAHRKVDVDLLIKMYTRDDMTTVQIGRELGLDPSTVRERLKDNGIYLKSMEDQARKRAQRNGYVGRNKFVVKPYEGGVDIW